MLTKGDNMGKTALKADSKNTWFYVSGVLATLQAARYTGIFFECLSSNIGVILLSALEAAIFIFFAFSIFFMAGNNMKKTIIPTVLVCLYMALNLHGLIALIPILLSSQVLTTPFTNIIRGILGVFFILLGLVYTLKCFGKFDNRKPLLGCAALTLALSYALLVANRFAANITFIDAFFTLDLADPALGIPLCITALTLSLKK